MEACKDSYFRWSNFFCKAFLFYKGVTMDGRAAVLWRRDKRQFIANETAKLAEKRKGENRRRSLF